MTDLGGLPSDASMVQTRALSLDRKAAALESGLRKANPTDNELLEASQQFEALMLNFMLREMRATVPEGTLLPRSMAEDLFTGMLDERMVDEMARHGGIGIARMIFDQLHATQSES